MIGLIFLPIINFLLQYHFSKVSKTLEEFKKHWICFWGDRYFLIINLAFGIFFIDIDNNIFIGIVIVSLIGNTLMHKIRYNRIQYNNYYGHLFQKEGYRLSKAGIIHLIFSIIEFIIIASGLFGQLQPIGKIIVPGTIAVFSSIIIIGGCQMSKTLGNTIHKQYDSKDVIIALGLFLFCSYQIMIAIML